MMFWACTRTGNKGMCVCIILVWKLLSKLQFDQEGGGRMTVKMNLRLRF
jgi:hypothetical protein